MRGISIVALAAALVLFAACGREEASPTSSPPADNGQPGAPGGGSQPFETIGTGQHSGVAGQEPRLLKIDTEEEWREFWSSHQEGVAPKPPPPEVDFSREMVIAAVDQRQPSGGYSYEIDAIEAVEGALTVWITRLVPGPNCSVPAIITRPFHIVRTAKSSATTDPVISEETYDCS